MIPTSRPITPLPVTLASIDCLDPELAVAAMQSGDSLPFARRIFFSHEKPENLPANIEWIQIKKITSVKQYSLFCIGELAAHIDTPHVLTVQTDGFVLRPELWNNAWLEYDYVGSPWPRVLSVAQHTQVGNSGFCLRSRKFLEAVAEMHRNPEYAAQWSDDLFPCHVGYKDLVKLGMRFAPLAAVERFAMEQPVDNLPQSLGLVFGFHGRLMPETRQLCASLVQHAFRDLFLRLTLHYPHPTHYDRAVEIDECLRANCGPGIFNEVLAVSPLDARLPCYRRLRRGDPIGFYRPTFGDLIKEVNQRTKALQVNVLAAEDIEFDPLTPTFFRRLGRNDFWCLSAWEVSGQGNHFVPPKRDQAARQHVWAWRGKCKIDPAAANFHMAQPGAASHFASLARAADYQIANPALTVKTMHVHENPVDEFSGAEVPRPHTRIAPHELGVPMFVHSTV